MSNAYYVLGNGFSIDLIQRLDKEEEIDLVNLFSMGEHVCYPMTNERGFLSRKYTPNLWDIGARTYISAEKALNIITDVITCANVYNLSRSNRLKEERDNSNIYIKAYGELSNYLRYLFIYYNSLVSDDELTRILPDIEIVSLIKNDISDGKQVKIITYNYDVYLERLLKLAGIEFAIAGFENKSANVQIFKPHGSISFSFKIKEQEYSTFEIRNEIINPFEQKAELFDVVYAFEADFPICSAIIPPAGDAGRCNHEWIINIMDKIKVAVNESVSKDSLILFGVSYWHVDRNEIDQILLSMDSQIDVKYVNPKPTSELEAVLSSLFKNYIHFSSGALLGGK